ncbi:MAG TPA: multiheme c-type cytochrome [Candidatus Dormibacteraeota bacterium]|nr:multiheme c-type cytochrome [Candidatus Dormibacteraeota bacterium]
MDIHGTSGRFLDLSGHISRDIMRVSNFDARDPDGKALEVTSTMDTVLAGAKVVETPRFRIAGPLPSQIRVHYQVSPGRREGDEHLGLSGRCFGTVADSFALVTGRAIFLVPKAAEGRIHVQFALPQGWAAFVPWKRTQDEWVVDLPGASPEEHLLATTIGLGTFRERSFRSGGTRFRFAFAPGIPDADADRASAAMQGVVRYVRGLMGRDIGSEYLAVLVPSTSQGDEVIGESWATGQGGTLTPLTPDRMHRFAEGLLGTYVRYAPNRTDIRRQEEFWLIDAVMSWYSWRAVARTGLVDEEESNRYLAWSYLGSVTEPVVDRNLEHYNPVRSDRFGREVLAPLVLLQLDHELRARYGQERGFDSMVPRLFAGRTAPSVWALVPNPSGSGWEEFRSRFVRGLGFVPVPDLFPLEHTRPQPTPSGGPTVRFLTLLYTGNTNGYLENCGCKINQSGGVARRATVVKLLRRSDPEAILLDAGNSFTRRQPFEVPNYLGRSEQRLYLETNDLMRYDAGAIGITELANGLEYYRDMEAGLRTPMLASNLSLQGTRLGPSSILLHSHGLRIAVMGLFGPPRSGISPRGFAEQSSRLSISDPLEVARREAPALRSKADLVIAMGHLSPSLIRRVAAGCPEISVIISTDHAAPSWVQGSTSQHREIQTDDESGFLGRTLVLYAHLGQYGISCAKVGVDLEGRIAQSEITDHWLRVDVADDRVIRERLNEFYDLVGRMPESQIGLRPPLSGDPYWQHKPYVGAETCSGCHPSEFAQWRTTGHAAAFKTLLDVHRHYQPKCVSCHVVGFGSEFGYRTGQPEEPLGNVQCEVCHGPGNEHVLAPARTNIRRAVPERLCVECHNEEHSDHFVYARSLPKVQHGAARVVSR